MAHTFHYVKEQRYISFRTTKKGIVVQLTQRGKDKIQKLIDMPKQIPPPKIWDGKWWAIAADIPTKQHRRAADLFRLKLKELHVYALQRSLWVYPFDPRAELEYLLKYFDIERYVTVMEISRLDIADERKLRKIFSGILKHVPR